MEVRLHLWRLGEWMRAIFISYRRADSEGQARALLKDLIARFGKEAVFIDVTGLAKGLDFRRVLEDRLATSGVLLAIIGKDWLDIKDEDGATRLDSPKDFVRLEIAAALKRNIPVIPVLVRGARMPRAEALPEDLKDLVFRDGVELTHARWDSDVEDLMRALTPYVDAAKLGIWSRPWGAPAGILVLALLCAAGYFGYGRFEENSARKATEDAEAKVKQIQDEKAAAEEAAHLKGTVDAQARRRKTEADEEVRIRIKKEADAKAVLTQQHEKPTQPVVRNGNENLAPQLPVIRFPQLQNPPRQYSEPQVSKVVPNSGPATGGIEISISGSGFTAATQVTFGGNPSPRFEVRSDSQIMAVLPRFPNPAIIDTKGYELDAAVCTAAGCSPQYLPGNFTYRR